MPVSRLLLALSHRVLHVGASVLGLVTGFTLAMIEASLLGLVLVVGAQWALPVALAVSLVVAVPLAAAHGPTLAEAAGAWASVRWGIV